jgi:membrane protease YdiL (CAAX protease family)
MVMRQIRLLFGSLALLAVLAFIARWIAKEMLWEYKLTYLAVLVFASCIASLLLGLQRRRLRQKLASLPEDDVLALSAYSDDIKFALPKAGSRSPRLTVVVGVVTVSFPTVPLLIGPILILQTWFPLEPPIPQFTALAVGLTVAWVWWSISASAWRRWARNGGMSAEEIQYHGERASIVWPRGHFFEKTEWENLRLRNTDTSI